MSWEDVLLSAVRRMSELLAGPDDGFHRDRRGLFHESYHALHRAACDRRHAERAERRRAIESLTPEVPTP